MREKDFIKNSYFAIAYHCGLLMIFEGIIALLPLLAIPFYPEETNMARCFIIPAALSFAAGLLIALIFGRNKKPRITITQGSIVILFSVLYSFFIGSAPLVLSGQYSWMHGIFESVSGWTCTGLTITNPDSAPHIILIWRSIIQFFGGAGFVLLMLSIFTGPSAMGVTRAGEHPRELLSHIKSSTRMVFRIYMIFLLLGAIALTMAGLPVFDAVNHAMTAVSTGGFSTHSKGIVSFDSAYVEIILIILMILGSVSFATHNQVFQGRIRAIYRDSEFRSSVVAFLIFAILIFIFVIVPQNITMWPGEPGFDPGTFMKDVKGAALSSIFETTAAITGTAFSTVDFRNWKPLGIFIIILAMCVGGQTISSSGGLKQLRIYLMFKSIISTLKSEFTPKSAVTADGIYKGENFTSLKPEHFRDLFNFVAIYALGIIIGTSILLYFGYPLQDSLFEFASAFGNAGHTIGITSASTPQPVMITLMFGMFFGRLEVFLIFYALIKLLRDMAAFFARDEVGQF